MGFDPSGCWNWGGFWAGVGIAAAGLAIIGLTVVTAGAATPLAAAAISAVGTGVGVAAVETGVAVTAAAATDSVAVLDVSCTDGSTSQKYGYSIVFDFGSNTGEVYSHYGTATSSSYSCSYGAGVVYNYNNPGDYGGSFIDVSASITKGGIDFGIDGCWDPSLKGTSAIMGTVGISLPPLRISPPITAGYDYYIPCCTFGW